jgi:hypothetical protein
MKGVKEGVVLFLFLLLSSNSYGAKEKGNQVSWKIHLKIVDEEGKILSGFKIFYDKELIGKVDTFGEWQGIIKRRTRDPFFLTLISYLHDDEFSKRVEIHSDENGLFVFDALVVFDRLSSSLNLNSLDQDLLLASNKRKALELIYFSFSEKKEAQDQYFSFGETLKLETALKKEASRLGFFYDMGALLQVYIEPLEREGGVGSVLSCGVHVRFPYEQKKTFFEYQGKTFSSSSWVEELFSEIKKRASIPFLIKRVDGSWFLSEKNAVQQEFWNFSPALELKSHLIPLQVSTKKRILDYETLYYLIPAEGNFCKFPDKDSCYLYSKPIIP